MDFDREMFKLHTKVNKGEIILGWYERTLGSIHHQYAHIHVEEEL